MQVEVEGNITKQPIAIFIDVREIHSYINPNLVGIFHMTKNKCNKSWLV